MNIPRKPDRRHTRGYIPHIESEGALQFVTFRLVDSMPQKVLEKWDAEIGSGLIDDADLRKRIERYLDQGYGSCWLKHREIAETVRKALFKWNSHKYELLCWVIMPNHVHILIWVAVGHELSDIMHSIKSYTAHEANKQLGRKGGFWFKESFDRYIRDGRHYSNVIRYIENNPVKARLCSRPEDWFFSSACPRWSVSR